MASIQQLNDLKKSIEKQIDKLIASLPPVADATGDEMTVTRVLVLHEDRVAAENRRCAVTLDDLFLRKVDLGIDAKAADDAGDWIPGHLHQLGCCGGGLGFGFHCNGAHDGSS